MVAEDGSAAAVRRPTTVRRALPRPVWIAFWIATVTVVAYLPDLRDPLMSADGVTWPYRRGASVRFRR